MTIQSLLYTIPAALIAISFHEFAHGFVSDRLGDPTPRSYGRLSLNPLAHLDPIGTICLILFRFGWAKPVMVNPNYYKNRKAGMVLVGLAGPVMNFIIALVSAIIMQIIINLTGGYVGNVVYAIFQFLNVLYIINIGLGVFNLIPFPPLDGAKVLGGLLPERVYFGLMRYERYGQFIIFALLATGALNIPLSMLRSGVDTVIWGIVNYLV